MHLLQTKCVLLATIVLFPCASFAGLPGQKEAESPPPLAAAAEPRSGGRSSIPEPAGAALVGLAGTLLLARRWAGR